MCANNEEEIKCEFCGIKFKLKVECYNPSTHICHILYNHLFIQKAINHFTCVVASMSDINKESITAKIIRMIEMEFFKSRQEGGKENFMVLRTTWKICFRSCANFPFILLFYRFRDTLVVERLRGDSGERSFVERSMQLRKFSILAS